MGELLKLFFIYGLEKTSQKPSEIYSQGKGPDSAGVFRYSRTGETNSGAL